MSTYDIFRGAWVIFALSGLLLSVKVLRLQIWRTMPMLSAWAFWTAAASVSGFVLNCLGSFTFRVFIARELFDIALAALAASEIYRRASNGVRVMGVFRSGIFHGALGLGVLVSVILVAFDAKITSRALSPYLVAFHAASIVLTVAISLAVAFLRTTGAPMTSNMKLHGFAMGAHLFVGAAGMLAANFTSTSQLANIACLVLDSVILTIWSLRLSRIGENLPRRIGESATATDFEDEIFASAKRLTGLWPGP